MRGSFWSVLTVAVLSVKFAIARFVFLSNTSYMANSVPNHRINNISFIGSFPNYLKAPEFDKPEFAFIGRSNVGKSSLLNYISGRKNIAKTSGTPGKTQMINLFNVEDEWIIADLPGYGYARVSKKTRAKWSKMITDYLSNRKNLKTVFILVDSRIAPLNADIEKMIWLANQAIPFSLIFTKSDKLKPHEVDNQVKSYLNRLKEDFEHLPNHFVTTSTSKRGASEILEYIHFIMEDN